MDPIKKNLPAVLKMGTNDLIMGADKTSDILSTTLFSKTRLAVLSLLYTHSDESFYLRQIARVAGVGMGSIQRELKSLAEAGIIQASTIGKQVFYQANSQCPVYAELKGLIVKTAGAGDILKSALASLVDRIQVAFIYGSFASGKERKASDVDACIVGTVTFAEIVSALNVAQQHLSREINPTVFPPDEFRDKVASHNHFLMSIIKGPKIFIVGDEHELAELAQ